MLGSINHLLPATTTKSEDQESNNDECQRNDGDDLMESEDEIIDLQTTKDYQGDNN